MNDELENLIRQWGQEGKVPCSAPAKPTPVCLTFAEAESVARGEPHPRQQAEAHAATCAYCKALVADFREALAEDVKATPRLVSHRPLTRRLVYASGLAAAVLIAAGVGIFLTLRPPADVSILALAEVGLQSQVEAGLRPRGPQGFASGDAIMVRVELHHGGHLALISVDPHGRIDVLAPKPPSQNLDLAATAGTVTLGPYTLDDTTGQETFLIVATDRPIDDLESRVAKLRSAYEHAADVNALAEQIRSWPAQVEVVTFEHRAPR